MKKEKIVPASAEATNTFLSNIEGIKQANSILPDVAPTDKKGGKVTERIMSLLDKCIESAPAVDNHLPRNFSIQNLVDNKATVETNNTKITALQREIQRLKDVNVYVGIQISEDYRTVYDASKKATKKDASLIPLRDQLGAPFKKSSPNAASKKAKKSKKLPAAV